MKGSKQSLNFPIFIECLLYVMHPDGSVQVDLAEGMMSNSPDTYAASGYFLMDAPGRPREQGLGDGTVGHRD